MLAIGEEAQRALPLRAIANSPEGSAALIMQRITAAAAIRGEVVISAFRLLFCCGLFIRFAFLGETRTWQPEVFNSAVLGLGMIFSVCVLLVRQRPLASRAVAWATSVDALICFLSLLQTVLWGRVSERYTGLLSVPDMLVAPLLVFAATFRLSSLQAALAAVLNGAGCAFLLGLEYVRFGPLLGNSGASLSLFSLLFATVALASISLAHRTRRLIEAASLDSIRVERAQQDLSELLRQQHDARNLLSAAKLNLDLSFQTLGEPTLRHGAGALQRLETVRRDLASVAELTRALGERAFGQLTALQSSQPVDTAQVLPPALSSLAARFPALAFEVELTDLSSVSLAGGAAGLHSILYNLIRNAAEGDGRRGANGVLVRTWREANALWLEVLDDGPGFSRAQLDAPPGSRLSAKPSGMGLGLYGVERLLDVNGGQLHRRNRDIGEHGASVRVVMPLASDSGVGAGGTRSPRH